MSNREVDDGTVVFENERYRVIVTAFPGTVKSHGGEYFEGYASVNKETGIAEVYSAQMPDAIAAAEQLDIAMDQQSWSWIRIQAEADGIQLAASTDTGEEPEVH